MPIAHVVFDIDGTLVDTEAAFQLSLQETAEQLLGRSPSMAELNYTFSMTTEAALAALGFPDVPSAHKVWEKKCMEKLGMMRVYDGIPQLLDALLLRGYVLGIVSSSTRREFQMVFGPLGLEDCFGREADRHTRLVKAKLGNDAGIIGAALLGLQVQNR